VVLKLSKIKPLTLRNLRVAGHLFASLSALTSALAVAEVLAAMLASGCRGEMHPDAFGFYEVTPILKTTHYKFAGELAAQILAKGTPDKDKAKVLAGKMVQIGDQFEAFSLIERILFIYIEAHGLLPT
jgi:hypothetical protein